MQAPEILRTPRELATAPLRALTSAAAVVLTGLVLIGAARELPNSIRTSQAQISETAGDSALERELAATRAVALNPTLLLRADELLPDDAVFYVATGVGMLSGHDAAGPFSAYWLLPRRRTDDVREAEWILSFGADRTQLGVEVDVVEDLGGAGQLLRVRR